MTFLNYILLKLRRKRKTFGVTLTDQSLVVAENEATVLDMPVGDNSPVRGGVIARYDEASKFVYKHLHQFVKWYESNPICYVAIPVITSEIELRALVDAFRPYKCIPILIAQVLIRYVRYTNFIVIYLAKEYFELYHICNKSLANYKYGGYYVNYGRAFKLRRFLTNEQISNIVNFTNNNSLASEPVFVICDNDAEMIANIRKIHIRLKHIKHIKESSVLIARQLSRWESHN